MPKYLLTIRKLFFSIIGCPITKVAFSLGLAYILLKQANIQETMAQLQEANLSLIAPAVIGSLAIIVIGAWRWWVTLCSISAPVSLARCVQYCLAGQCLSLFLPSTVGGDFLRVFYAAYRHQIRKRDSLATFIAERFYGLFSLLLLLLGCSWFYQEILPTWTFYLTAVLFVGLICFLVLVRTPMAQQQIQNRLLGSSLAEAPNHIRALFGDYRMLIQMTLASLLIHTGQILIHVLVAEALGLHIPFGYLAVVYGLGGLISALPISFNGIGLREGAYQYLLGLYGISSAPALSFGLYWLFILTLSGLAAGLVFVFTDLQMPGQGQRLEEELD
jgi:uncharacterized protein (TIRG00374 family)